MISLTDGIHICQGRLDAQNQPSCCRQKKNILSKLLLNPNRQTPIKNISYVVQTLIAVHLRRFQSS